MEGKRIGGFGDWEVAGEELRREEGGNWRGWRRVNEPCRSRSTFAGVRGGDCRTRRAIEDWLQQRRGVKCRQVKWGSRGRRMRRERCRRSWRRTRRRSRSSIS